MYMYIYNMLWVSESRLHPDPKREFSPKSEGFRHSDQQSAIQQKLEVMAWCSKSQHLTEILMNYINHWIMITKVNRILNLQLAQPPPISALRKPQGAPASARPSRPAAAHPTTEPAGWSNMPGSSKPWGWGQNWDQQWKMVILKLTVILYNCIILRMILSSDISLDDGIMQLFVIIWAMILSSNSWWVLRSTTWGQNGSKGHRHWNLQSTKKLKFPASEVTTWLLLKVNDGVSRIPYPPLAPDFMIVKTC